MKAAEYGHGKGQGIPPGEAVSWWSSSGCKNLDVTVWIGIKNKLLWKHWRHSRWSLELPVGCISTSTRIFFLLWLTPSHTLSMMDPTTAENETSVIFSWKRKRSRDGAEHGGHWTSVLSVGRSHFSVLNGNKQHVRSSWGLQRAFPFLLSWASALFPHQLT